VPRIPGISDVVTLLQQQTELLASLPSTMVSLNKAIRSLSKSLEQSEETFVTVQRLATRLDRMMDDLEEPMRELGPGLRRLAVVLDDPALDELPTTIRALQAEGVPAIQGLRETQQRVAVIAASTERLIAGVEDVANRLGALPGASLLRRQWRSATAPPEEM
jgi:ABC-type transporter Mla subunit MlaD